MIEKWEAEVKKTLKEYQDLAYNAHMMLRDYYTYEDITWMPLRNLLDKIDEFSPRLREIARQQEQDRLKAEMEGKRNQQKPQKRGSRKR